MCQGSQTDSDNNIAFSIPVRPRLTFVRSAATAVGIRTLTILTETGSPAPSSLVFGPGVPRFLKRTLVLPFEIEPPQIDQSTPLPKIIKLKPYLPLAAAQRHYSRGSWSVYAARLIYSHMIWISIFIIRPSGRIQFRVSPSISRKATCTM